MDKRKTTMEDVEQTSKVIAEMRKLHQQLDQLDTDWWDNAMLLSDDAAFDYVAQEYQEKLAEIYSTLKFEYDGILQYRANRDTVE